MAKNEIQITEDTMCNWYCDCSLSHEGCFELNIKYGDCKQCCHMGICDDDCEMMRTEGYIRKQLDEISNEQMFGYIREYVCDEDISEKVKDRDWLELYLIWIVAGNIIDEVYCGENLESLIADC